jgi:hypothetical protein
MIFRVTWCGLGLVPISIPYIAGIGLVNQATSMLKLPHETEVNKFEKPRRDVWREVRGDSTPDEEVHRALEQSRKLNGNREWHKAKPSGIKNGGMRDTVRLSHEYRPVSLNLAIRLES